MLANVVLENADKAFQKKICYLNAENVTELNLDVSKYPCGTLKVHHINRVTMQHKDLYLSKILYLLRSLKWNNISQFEEENIAEPFNDVQDGNGQNIQYEIHSNLQILNIIKDRNVGKSCVWGRRIFQKNTSDS